MSKDKTFETLQSSGDSNPPQDQADAIPPEAGDGDEEPDIPGYDDCIKLEAEAQQERQGP